MKVVECFLFLALVINADEYATQLDRGSSKNKDPKSCFQELKGLVGKISLDGVVTEDGKCEAHISGPPKSQLWIRQSRIGKMKGPQDHGCLSGSDLVPHNVQNRFYYFTSLNTARLDYTKCMNEGRLQKVEYIAVETPINFHKCPQSAEPHKWGIIQNYDYPLDPPKNLECKSKIRNPSGRSITLTLVAAKDHASHQFEVFDGKKKSTVELVLGQQWTTEGTELEIEYVPSANNGGGLFALEWNRDDCRTTHEEVSGVITLKSMRGAGKECGHAIKVPEGKIIEFMAPMDMPTGFSVGIFDGKTQEELEIHHAKDSNVFYYHTKSNEAFVDWSAPTGTGQTFKLEYHPVSAGKIAHHNVKLKPIEN